jgi:hypothetical protein
MIISISELVVFGTVLILLSGVCGYLMYHYRWMRAYIIDQELEDDYNDWKYQQRKHNKKLFG